MKESFIFYRSFYEALIEMSKENQADCLMAIANYALNGEEPTLTPEVRLFFTLVKPQIDANNQRFLNGKKGGRPKKTKTKPKNNQTKTETEPNVNVNDNVNVNVNKNNIKLHSPQSRNFAERLSEIVKKQKNVNIDEQKINQWAKSIDLLIKKDGVDEERIERALTWYSENVGGDFVPDIECGKTFREKFGKIESAIKRATPKQETDNDFWRQLGC